MAWDADVTPAEKAAGEAACAFLDAADPVLLEACVADVVCGGSDALAAWHGALGAVEVYPIDDSGIVDPCHTAADALTPDANDTATLTCPDCSGVTYCYGTGVYTTDSGVCAAAAHAGVIDLAVGGTVTIHFLPGEDSYAGSTQNGIDCAAWGFWPSSFEVLP